MGRRALVLAVLTAVTARAQPVLITGASTSATWDSNVTRSAQPEGGLFVDGTAHVGGGLALLDERLLLTGLVLYRGRMPVTLEALTSHVFVGSAAASLRVVPWLRLGVSGVGGYTLLSDPTRSGPRADARAFFRAMPLDWLDVRGGYAWLYRVAADPVFTTANHEVSLSLELHPLTWLELSAGWSFSTGGDVVFVSTPAGSATTSGARGAGWLGGSSGGELWVPTPTRAQTHAVSATAFALLPKGFGAGVEFTWLTSDNALQPWSGWIGSVVASWDLP
ncbi:MAG: hypothetical protein ACOZQL_42260 [Myxococcota bacterium]